MFDLKSHELKSDVIDSISVSGLGMRGEGVPSREQVCPMTGE